VDETPPFAVSRTEGAGDERNHDEKRSKGGDLRNIAQCIRGDGKHFRLLDQGKFTLCSLNVRVNSLDQRGPPEMGRLVNVREWVSRNAARGAYDFRFGLPCPGVQIGVAAEDTRTIGKAGSECMVSKADPDPPMRPWLAVGLQEQYKNGI
jgi:hypothetical protein